jgi:trimethylamine-N-oxide reductase (cytochrome c), cytochrome c-type subunit TorC
MTDPSGKPPGRARAALGLIVLGVAIGIAAMFAGQEADTYFSSNQFCNSCHTMEATVSQELQHSAHAKAASGVQPTCAHCHVAQKLFPALWDHFMGTGDLIAHLRGISTVEKFEGRRAEAADKERLKMLGQNSRNCQRCHVMAAIQPSKPRGAAQHKEALAKGNSNCIACHYNLAHKEVPVSEDFAKAAEKYQ